MSEDLQNEVEAINAIYGADSLVSTDFGNVYILHLPQQPTSLRIKFPVDYPSTPPATLGIESSGDNAQRGEAAYINDVFREVLESQYHPGEVCLFDVIEEVNSRLSSVADADFQNEDDEEVWSEQTNMGLAKGDSEAIAIDKEPPWTISDVAIELKSVFIARAAPVSSPEQAAAYLQHLLTSDKKVRSATHNITAWRVKGVNGVTYQDCDDDGETAAGGRVLHLMQLMDIWDVMVVVTRWYGGHQLGPKRFSIINTVARDACVKGGFVKDEPASKKKGKH